ncbi:uncharacterized protein LAESUDRAFT_713987 [Laetiporus sulphureus 93-53]|uniref:Uncharacterized protein n=1 Tax=Laetiporus sulphureus 93-53 TaxID=1314785 RepID=A0A165EE82_9APHY|nr:uncharacterized protein LAESUDRAFT_713987 [Laetiporus sulphureus 93-53]KZT06851.1 hypothetical protein LAESUDRAFT_713987 [Laetiporus sulphureus 93-53]
MPVEEAEERLWRSLGSTSQVSGTSDRNTSPPQHYHVVDGLHRLTKEASQDPTVEMKQIMRYGWRDPLPASAGQFYVIAPCRHTRDKISRHLWRTWRLISMYGINLNPTLGAAFIGIFFYGITALQTIYYFMTYPKDKLHLKLLVFILWILDTTSLAFVAHGVYTLLVLDFGNFLALEYAEPMVLVTIALIVHLFLVYHIWTLNQNWWKYAIFLVLFSIAPFSTYCMSVLTSLVGVLTAATNV